MTRYQRLALRSILLLAIASGFFYNLRAIPLFDVDEGAFGEATREMLARGDFISPYLNAAPRFDKPVLIHWLQAASVSVLGFNEFALRLPSALAASLWVNAVYAFLRRFKDERTALFAAIAMATSLEIPLIAKAATADALLNLFIATAALSAYLFYHDGRRLWLYAGYALMGLGFLTKGPIAVLIPTAAISLFYFSKGDVRGWLRGAFNPAGIAIFLMVALPWYIAQYLQQGDAFLQGFFLKHNIGRFESAMENHSGSITYYFPVVLLGILPYTTLLITTLIRAKTLWRDDLGRYALIWLGFVFVFFSLSGTKLPHYIVYGYTGLFIAMALSREHPPARIWLLLPPLLLFLILLALPELIAYALPGIHDAFVRDMLADYASYFTTDYRVFFLACAALSLYFMAKSRLAKSVQLLICGFLAVFGVSAYVMPVVGGLLQSPIKEAALLANQRHYKVVMWGLNTPSFEFYSGQLAERRQPRPGDVVLTKSPLLSQFGKSDVLYQKNGIVLARLRPHEITPQGRSE